jgi:hypothetical protein
MFAFFVEGVSRFGKEGLKRLWKEINLFLTAKKASIFEHQENA